MSALNIIRAAIDKAGGAITFAEYMQLALYAPTVGYYSSTLPKFGKDGDFITAPEISPLFGQCLANAILASKGSDPSRGSDPDLAVFSVLEFGAGSGKLAATVLAALDDAGHCPAHYYILEVSAALRAQQRAHIQQHLPATLSKKVVWLDKLPASPFNGVILANEVLDAMPVHRCQRSASGSLQEYYVTWQKDHLDWQLGPLSSPRLEAALENVLSLGGVLSLRKQGSLQEDSCFRRNDEGGRNDRIFEINLNIAPWVASLSDILAYGQVFLIDYGYLADDYYHPDRHMGTLMCHRQHRAHADLLAYPGEQDITAHVDFTAVGKAAEKAGFTVTQLSTQAQFLLAHGLIDLAEKSMRQGFAKNATEQTIQQYEIAQHIKYLTLPSEMGERFKVMQLTKAHPSCEQPQ